MDRDNIKRYAVYALIIFLAAAIGVLLGQFATSYELRFIMNRQYCGTYRGIDVYKSGEINEPNFLSHVYKLRDAPDELTECCERLYFTGSDLDILPNDSGYSHALGLTQGTTVYISTDSYGEDVVYHELFHAYDCAKGNLSASEPFLEAYNAESRKLYVVTTGFDSSRPAEFFATAGAFYLLSPEMLKKGAPKTFEYMDNLLNLYETEDEYGKYR